MKKILFDLLKVAVLAAALYVRIMHPFIIHQPYMINIIQTLATFIIFIVSAKLLLQVVDFYLRRNKKASANLSLGLRNLYYIFLGLAVVMLGLSFIGIDYRTLFTSLSIVAAAIAIVTKEFIAEIVCGVILSFSQRIYVNDYVRIGTMRGKILDMGLQKITFLNDDDDIIFIPNTKVYNNEIVNYTQSDQQRINIDFQITFAHVEDFEQLEEELQNALDEHKSLIVPGTFLLKIMSFTKDTIDLKLLFTSISSEREQIRELRRKATRKVLNYVRSKMPGSGG